MISNEKLIELYSGMVKCRMIAERAGLLARMGRVTPGLDGGIGREASIAGIAADLQPGDTLCPSREVLVAEFLRGTPIEKVFAKLATSPNGRADAGKVSGVAERAEAQPQLESACKAAKVHKTAKDGRVAVVFCGEMQTHSGRWRRSLSLANGLNLPMIFVRHLELRDGLDNLATQRKMNEAPPEALAFGVPLIQVDGNDVIAVYRVASESIARARERRGPTLIDCVTDISADHFGNQSGNQASDQRPAGGLDPIHVMESHLAGKRVLKPGLRKKIENAFAPELDRGARALPDELGVRPARSKSMSEPFNPGPRFTFIPGNDVL